jgi:protein-S-isoprenylcysteine O-methyltransferase Ste14
MEDKKRDRVSQKAKTVLWIIFGVVLILVLFFVPAGTFNWPEAWVSLILYDSALIGMIVWLRKRDPELLKERQSRKKDVKPWDKKILRVYTGFLAAIPIVAGLDAVRFGWSHVPLGVKLLAFSGFIPAGLIMFWATAVNTYLSQVVRIQIDRDHKVITTGPYAYVRHPMYVGIILFMICFPLALGSIYALIPGLAIVALYILRTSLEDKILQEELPGYKEYAQKVRFKLIPGIW